MSPDVAHGIDRSNEGHRWDNDLIPGFDAGEQQGHVQGCGAARACHGFGRSRYSLRKLLEETDGRPEVTHPVSRHSRT